MNQVLKFRKGLVIKQNTVGGCYGVITPSQICSVIGQMLVKCLLNGDNFSCLLSNAYFSVIIPLKCN